MGKPDDGYFYKSVKSNLPYREGGGGGWGWPRGGTASREASNPATRASNPASTMVTSFEDTGPMDDLEQSILSHRTVLSLLPPDHPDRSAALESLTTELLARFRQTGRMENLDECIQLHRESLALLPPGHPDLSRRLSYLTTVLLTHFEKTGQTKYLEECFDLYGDDVLLPFAEPDRSASMDNLRSAILARFEKMVGPADRHKCIELYCAALFLSPLDHPSETRLTMLRAGFEGLKPTIATSSAELGNALDLVLAVFSVIESVKPTEDVWIDLAAYIGDITLHLIEEAATNAEHRDLQGVLGKLELELMKLLGTAMDLPEPNEGLEGFSTESDVQIVHEIEKRLYDSVSVLRNVKRPGEGQCKVAELVAKLQSTADVPHVDSLWNAAPVLADSKMSMILEDSMTPRKVLGDAELQLSKQRGEDTMPIVDVDTPNSGVLSTPMDDSVDRGVRLSSRLEGETSIPFSNWADMLTSLDSPSAKGRIISGSTVDTLQPDNPESKIHIRIKTGNETYKAFLWGGGEELMTRSRNLYSVAISWRTSQSGASPAMHPEDVVHVEDDVGEAIVGPTVQTSCATALVDIEGSQPESLVKAGVIMLLALLSKMRITDVRRAVFPQDTKSSALAALRERFALCNICLDGICGLGARVDRSIFVSWMIQDEDNASAASLNEMKQRSREIQNWTPRHVIRIPMHDASTIGSEDLEGCPNDFADQSNNARDDTVTSQGLPVPSSQVTVGTITENTGDLQDEGEGSTRRGGEGLRGDSSLENGQNTEGRTTSGIGKGKGRAPSRPPDDNSGDSDPGPGPLKPDQVALEVTDSFESSANAEITRVQRYDDDDSVLVVLQINTYTEGSDWRFSELTLQWKFHDLCEYCFRGPSLDPVRNTAIPRNFLSRFTWLSSTSSRHRIQTSLEPTDAVWYSSTDSERILGRAIWLQSSNAMVPVRKIAPRSAHGGITTRGVTDHWTLSAPSVGVLGTTIGSMGSMDRTNTRNAQHAATLKSRTLGAPDKVGARWNWTENSDSRQGIPPAFQLAVVVARDKEPFLIALQLEATARRKGIIEGSYHSRVKSDSTIGKIDAGLWPQCPKPVIPWENFLTKFSGEVDGAIFDWDQ